MSSSDSEDELPIAALIASKATPKNGKNGAAREPALREVAGGAGSRSAELAASEKVVQEALATLETTLLEEESAKWAATKAKHEVEWSKQVAEVVEKAPPEAASTDGGALLSKPGLRGWSPGSGLLSSARRVALQLRRGRGARTRYGTAALHGLRHAGLCDQLPRRTSP